MHPVLGGEVVKAVPHGLPRVTLGYMWSPLGDVATVTYPQKSGVGSARTITNTYTHGFLTKIAQGATNYASAISYHTNATVNRVTTIVPGITTSQCVRLSSSRLRVDAANAESVHRWRDLRGLPWTQHGPRAATAGG
jgi:hypothetical protein